MQHDACCCINISALYCFSHFSFSVLILLTNTADIFCFSPLDINAVKHSIAIVTGSTSGIGETIARMLSQEGTKVVINSASSQEKGQEIADELQSLYCQADIGIEADCERLITATIKHYGRLDFPD